MFVAPQNTTLEGRRLPTFFDCVSQWGRLRLSGRGASTTASATASPRSCKISSWTMRTMERSVCLTWLDEEDEEERMDAWVGGTKRGSFANFRHGTSDGRGNGPTCLGEGTKILTKHNREAIAGRDSGTTTQQASQEEIRGACGPHGTAESQQETPVIPEYCSLRRERALPRLKNLAQGAHPTNQHPTNQRISANRATFGIE